MRDRLDTVSSKTKLGTRFTVLLIIVLGMIAGCSATEEGILDATVASVTDGDTIVVELDHGEKEKVRMILIDTPEMNHPEQGIQPFAKEATQYTSEQLTGKEVQLELDVEARDQYGRLLAYVWLEDSHFNQMLIEEGFARVEVFPPNTKYAETFYQTQKEAKQEKKGIWSLENYVQNHGFSPIHQEKEKLPENTGDCIDKIKGNTNSKIYHLPDGVHYHEVSEQNIVWFCSETEAREAGYRPSKR